MANFIEEIKTMLADPTTTVADIDAYVKNYPYNDMGRAIMLLRGDYDPTRAYEQLDLVKYDNKTWLCQKDCQGEVPSDTSIYWQTIVENGADGVSVTGVSQTAQSGLIKTYTMTFSDGTDFSWQIVDGQSGSGTGDMTKSVYDKTDNGMVDLAEELYDVTNNKKANTIVLANLTDDGAGGLEYKGQAVGGAVKVDTTTITKNASNELTLASSVTAKLAEQILGVISGDTITFTDSKYINGTDDYLLDPYVSDTDRFLKSQSISGHTLTVVCDDVIASGSVAVCLVHKKGV